MNESLQQKVRGAIAEFGMFERGEGVVVAVSGGADSLALLLVLHELAPQIGIRLTVGHLHHGLRGEDADADARFVQEVAEGLGLECFVGHADVGAVARALKVGVEDAGRQARYEFLEALARRCGASKIALGHTGSDVVETVLMNLLRGCGLDGMLGIPPVRGAVVRPLIRATRRETEAFCRSRGLVPRRDSSNLDERFLRARVRQRILPVIEAELGGGFEQKALEAVELLRADAELLRKITTDAFSRLAVQQGAEPELKVREARALPHGLLRRVVREGLRKAQQDLQNIERAHVDAVCALITSGRTGATVQLPSGLEARRGYDTVVIRRTKASDDSKLDKEPVPLHVPGKVLLRSAGLWLQASLERPPKEDLPSDRWEAWLDLAYCGRDLSVRSWRPGDRFQPLGLGRTKKMQDFFVDHKVPRDLRSRVPIVTRSSGEVLWVVGYRIDHRARLTDRTQTALRLTAMPIGMGTAANGGAEDVQR